MTKMTMVLLRTSIETVVGLTKIIFTEDVMMNMTKMTMTLMDHD